MTYTTREQQDGTLAVYDGPHYVGIVEAVDGGFAASKQDETEQANFSNQADGVGWLIAEFRGISWADRPASQRVMEA